MAGRPKKQVVDLPLVGGLNTKMTPKGVTPPDLLTLTNGVYNKEGRIDKKFGYKNLGQSIDNGTLNTPTALGSIRDELLMFSTDRLYSYSDTSTEWVDKGRVSAAVTSIEPITASPNSCEGVDVIVQDNIKLATWLEDGVYYYSVFDQSTNASIVNREILTGGGSTVYPRLATLPGFIYILYNSSTNLKYVRIPTSNPSTLSSGTLYTTLDSNGIFDVMGIGSHLYTFFKLTGVSTARLSKIDVDLTVVATNTISTDPTNYATTSVYAFYSESENENLIALGWVDGSDNIKTAIYDTSLVQTIAPTTIETVANIDKLIMALDSTNGDTVGYYYSISAADTTDHFIKTSAITLDGTIGSASVFLRSAGIASKSIYHNNVGYFNILHDSSLQATYFTVDTVGKISAKTAASEGGTHAITRRPSNFTALNDTGDYVWGGLKKGRVQSENATLFADISPYFATFSLDPAKSFTTFPANDSLIIPGSILQVYDGHSTTEHGFHLYPENIETGNLTGTGSIANGTYLIYSIYEWTNARGTRFQSAPSIAKSVTLTGSEVGITVATPALRLTDKTSNLGFTDRASVQIRVFMTENNGTIPYFAASVSNPDILASDSIGLNLTVDPSLLTSNEILYTSGGAIENIAAPSHGYAFTHDNRIITLTKNQIRFSKQIRSGSGTGFNEDFAITLDPLGGDNVAGASMDQYMIVFKETATWAIAGSGPNDLGQNNNFGDPQLISSDIGCRDIKSVLQTPDGIIFMSNKGVYLLDRGLSLSYIGDKVEQFNSHIIKSSDILKNSNEIRLVTDQDITLVYNYYFGRWSIFNTVGALDATTWKTSEYVYLTPTKTMKEDSSTYLDDGSYVPTTIRTGWIHLGGMQGYQRIYQLGILGDYHNNHTFSLKYFYDYSDIVKDTDTITAATLVNTAVYGDSATYGADDYYGGSQNDEVYQTRNHMPRQKMQSLSVEIKDSIIGSNEGQGFSLEGLSLLIGVKGGLVRTSQTRST